MNSARSASTLRIEPVGARGPSFGLSNRMTRVVWQATWLLLASWTPAAFHPWRRFLLRSFGAQMGSLTDVRGSARVWYPPHLTLGDGAMLAERVNCYSMALIKLESGALVSQGAHLCAGSHDINDIGFRLVAEPITIGANAWIAAEAFVGPGVRVGEGAVLGARAVAFRDLEPWTVYVGNPASAKRRRVLRNDES